MLQGFHTFWKVLDYFLDFLDPGVFWKLKLKVMENESHANENLGG